MEQQLLIVLLLFILITVTHSEIVICQNQTIALKAGEITYFQTKNFPYIKFNESQDFCQIKFTFPDGYAGSMMVYDPTLQDDQMSYVNCYQNDGKYCLFETTNTKHTSQGYAFYDEFKDCDCVLESFSSRISPFMFTDETQILVIDSHTYAETNAYIWCYPSRKHPCRWRFEAPEGYGFKVVIIHVNLKFNVQLTIQNSTNYDIISSKPKIHHPYYNEDNHLNIFLSNNTYYENKQEFGAYISIVRNNPKIIDANCMVETIDSESTGSKTVFSNAGYPNNAKCVYDLVIEQDTEIFMEMQSIVMERHADLISYFDIYGNLQTFNDVDNDYLLFKENIFKGYNNDTPRTVQFNFTSDGSVQGSGFVFWFTKIFCTCAETVFVAPCDCETKYFITNTTDAFGYYCGDMKCNFSIEIDPNCTNKDILAHISMLTYDKIYVDSFKIYSNNQTVFAMKPYLYTYYTLSGEQTIILKSNATNIFEAVTSASPARRNINIILSTIKSPKIDMLITLNDSFPYSAIQIADVAVHNFLVVKVITNLTNPIIEITSNFNFGKGVLFYQDGSITHMDDDENCFSSSAQSGFYCKMLNKQFSIYILNHQESVLFFQLSSKHHKGCIFENNVVLGVNADLRFSAIANGLDSCKVYVLVDISLGYIISYMWTNTKNNDVKLYMGTTEKFILGFNATTDFQWFYNVLWSNFYIFEIPINSSLLFQICIQMPCSIPDYFGYIQSGDFGFFLTTRFYGDSINALSISSSDKCNQWNYYNYFWITYDPYATYSICFFIAEYDVSENFYFNISINGITQNVSKVGNFIAFNTTDDVKLCYGPTKDNGIPMYDYSGVVIHANVFRDTKRLQCPFNAKEKSSFSQKYILGGSPEKGALRKL